ncbi:MAG: GtrA family protein [Clostridia bacterium]|nr:GtrA family protein [Clostridia bacterium]
MLDRILEKILDFFLDSDVMLSLEKIDSLKGIIDKIKDKKFMIHIIKYLFFGFLTTVLSLGSFWILIEFSNLNENICNFISIVVGVLSAYALNREYVFESKEKDIFKEFSKFVMARVFSAAFDMITFFILVTCLSLNEMVVKILISIGVIIMNYFLSKLIVFKKNNN